MQFTSYANARQVIQDDTPGLDCSPLQPEHVRAPKARFSGKLGPVTFHFDLESVPDSPDLLVRLARIRAVVGEGSYEIQVSQYGQRPLLKLLDLAIRNAQWADCMLVRDAEDISSRATVGYVPDLMLRQLKQNMPGIQWKKVEGSGARVLLGLVQTWDSTSEPTQLVRLELSDDLTWKYEIELEVNHQTRADLQTVSQDILEDLTRFQRILRRIVDGARDARKKR